MGNTISPNQDRRRERSGVGNGAISDPAWRGERTDLYAFLLPGLTGCRSGVSRMDWPVNLGNQVERPDAWTIYSTSLQATRL